MKKTNKSSSFSQLLQYFQLPVVLFEIHRRFKGHSLKGHIFIDIFIQRVRTIGFITIHWSINHGVFKCCSFSKGYLKNSYLIFLFFQWNGVHFSIFCVYWLIVYWGLFSLSLVVYFSINRVEFLWPRPNLFTYRQIYGQIIGKYAELLADYFSALCAIIFCFDFTSTSSRTLNKVMEWVMQLEIQLFQS